MLLHFPLVVGSYMDISSNFLQAEAAFIKQNSSQQDAGLQPQEKQCLNV